MISLMKDSYEWLKKKDDDRRKRVYTYIEFPLTAAATIVAFGLSVYFFVQASEMTKATEEPGPGFFGLVCFMIASMCAVYLLVGRSINDETHRPSSPDKKPLLCSCGTDKSTVYAIPILRFSWPLWAAGTSLGSLIATYITGNILLLMFIPAFAFYAAVIFAASAIEFLATKHTLRCAAIRGFTNIGYYLFAYFVDASGKDPYEKRKVN